MGGVADYSGSMVLEAPTTVSTTVSVKHTATREVSLSSTAFGQLTVPGFLDFLETQPREFELKLLRDWLGTNQIAGWAHYVLGSFAVFYRETGWLPAAKGIAMHVASDVPTGMGVSSSASLEVATIRALASLSGLSVPDLRVAHLAQAAENHVVGAPCGLMDQLACSVGVQGKLLPILCRPDLCSKPVSLPDTVVVAGWPSGVEHQLAAGESPYLAARTATFMAQAMADRILGARSPFPAAIDPYSFRAKVVPLLPATVSGCEFLLEHGPLSDPMSSVQPDRLYPVLAALRFAVEENQRCHTVLALLRGLETGATSREIVSGTLAAIGGWMLDAHVGYTEIGLGCRETDQMVEALTVVPGVYGARVSGGGSGGTVVVLMEKEAVSEVEKLAKGLTFGKPFPGFVF